MSDVTIDEEVLQEYRESFEEMESLIRELPAHFDALDRAYIAKRKLEGELNEEGEVPVRHEETAVGWFCHEHSATFEPQEAERNDDQCPWCGGSVDL